MTNYEKHVSYVSSLYDFINPSSDHGTHVTVSGHCCFVANPLTACEQQFIPSLKAGDLWKKVCKS